MGGGDEAHNMDPRQDSHSHQCREIPYEMRHKKKPHLAGIQEFGTVVYIKDLKARKLDSHTKVGQFVSYDLESKVLR